MAIEFRYAELLRLIREKLGGEKGRVRAQLGVSDKTLDGWLTKNDDQLKASLHSSNKEAILGLAKRLRIPFERFSISGTIWDPYIGLQANLERDPGTPPTIHFRDHQIPFVGLKVRSRFGASASVLTASVAGVRFLAHSGCDVIVTKTVRDVELPCHPGQNLLYCAETVGRLDPDNLPKDLATLFLVGAQSGDTYHPRFGMMNRFGVPSPPPEVWQATFRAAKAELIPGQLLIASVIGTAKRGDPDKTLIASFVRTFELALAASATVVELNLSCPNTNGPEASVCHNLPLLEAICKAVKPSAGSAKILLKISYLPETDLRELISRIAYEVDGFSTINTVPVEGQLRGQTEFEPAFGKPGLKAGLSGPPILRLGLRCVTQLADMLEREGLEHLGIIGGGGVSSASEAKLYLDSGADVVQATNGFFADPAFGIKVRECLDRELSDRETVSKTERRYALDAFADAMDELEDHYKHLPESSQQALQRAAASVLVEWKERHARTISMGPRKRIPVPTVEEFKAAINKRFQSLPD